MLKGEITDIDWSDLVGLVTAGFPLSVMSLIQNSDKDEQGKHFGTNIM